MDTTATAITVLVGTVALLGLVAALIRVVVRDGLGHRPPPAHRHDWAEGTSVEIDRSARVDA
ncbi:hypothetical protein [Cellulomonas sp. URHB0016]